MRKLLALGLGIAVATGAFFGTRFAYDAFLAEAGPPPPVALTQEIVEEDAAKPRFVGSLLGIFIRPLWMMDMPFPPGVRTYASVCGEEPTIGLPWSSAGVFDLNVELPPEYDLQENDMNTGVIGCGDKVIAARWSYERVFSAEEPPAYVLIVRSLFNERAIEAAADRVQVTKVGGRDAILVKPILPSTGEGGPSAVIFSAPFGQTAIITDGLPLDDLLALAELVAQEAPSR